MRVLRILIRIAWVLAMLVFALVVLSYMVWFGLGTVANASELLDGTLSRVPMLLVTLAGLALGAAILWFGGRWGWRLIEGIRSDAEEPAG